MAEVAVLGGGSWGTALAQHAARCGHQARLLFRDAGMAAEVAQRHCNETYLPDITLAPGVRPTADPGAALQGADLILVVTPVRGLEQAVAWMSSLPVGDTPVVSCAKGIRPESLETPLQALARMLPESASSLGVLSGPTFAVELARGDPSAAVVAASDLTVARRVQTLLNGDFFRLYTNQDPVGVELAGALKNVMALASGVVAGLGLGANSTAALITRGLAEMSRLGLSMGGAEATFAGLAGLGDLVLTCTSALSRNFTVGRELGRGRPLDEILHGMRMVAEGVPTTRSALKLSRRHEVEMPIVQQMHRLLFEGLEPGQAVEALLARAPREENDMNQDDA